MSRNVMSSGSVGVGNEFIVKVRREPPARSMVGLNLMAAGGMPAMAGPMAAPAPSVRPHFEMPEVYESSLETASRFGRGLDLLHRYSMGAFALLFLLVASSAIQLAGSIAGNKIEQRQAAALSAPHRQPTQPLTGYNTTVPLEQLQTKLTAITGQSLTLDVAGQTSVVQADTIQSWLKIVKDKQHDVAYLHVNASAVSGTLGAISKQFTKDPVSQVTITHSDGTGGVYVAGKNGLKVDDYSQLAKQISTHVMAGSGMNLTMPTETVPFPAVTQAAFAKLLEVNVATHQMYAYDNGQLTRSFAISAGAPATPTPLGEFHIFSKLAVQDMKGTNPNGTPYFQPHVHWINYFLPGGYAVHGNYWRPLSVFGTTNTSHGCVSLPDDQAKWVYDWAPLNTPVITHV